MKKGIYQGSITDMNNCPMCNTKLSISSLIYEYDHWNLFLHADEKRQKTKLAAGFLATKNHIAVPVEASAEAWAELQAIVKDASSRLCQAAESTYLDQETVGFNQGEYTGQTINHAHVHVFPVSEEDPIELRARGGMSGAFEALRRDRLDD